MTTKRLQQVSPPCQLSSGAVVFHRPEPNGSQFAYINRGSGEMTDDEWQEYCVKRVAKLSIRQAA